MNQEAALIRQRMRTPLPFAGIAFLWFIAVVRDRLGELEDRFFVTVFLGSGSLYIAMTLIAAAVAGGTIRILGSGSRNPDPIWWLRPRPRRN
jgi:hypothetical protein